ncbi:DinB family protein [Gramella sp. MAR_2010_147]|uniref:DinB family protein n=1 Tax=Gramella sp. MAR_2010_147 TaxID=1250205 RepID=UPI00087BD691|nr:DinB family protein [Gramella sp. MAR_2010_147]SDR66199.1 DinB superfamily protein [Gramella sp. MAR_2010_147]
MIQEIEQRNQLVKHLEGGLAFASIESFIDAIPFEKIGVRPSGLPYSFYEVFFHITFSQKDILEYTISGNYETHNWPDDYWPAKPDPNNEEEWEDLKAEYFEDRRIFREYILDLNNELNEPVPNSEEHTLLREIFLVVEHTAYHTGQLLMIQRLLGVYDN